MRMNSVICYFCLLFCGLDLVYSTAYQGRLCQEKAKIFDKLTRRLTRVLAAKDSSNYNICSKLSGYISHALYTQDTCPGLPIVNNATFQNTVELMNSDFNSRCDAADYSIVSYPCSPAMIHFLVKNCNRYVDEVQFSMPRLEVCDISKNFIACHEESLRECQYSSLFNKYHVVQALQVTRDSLNFMCDESLANEPWENGPEVERSSRSVAAEGLVVKSSKGGQKLKRSIRSTGSMSDLLGLLSPVLRKAAEKNTRPSEDLPGLGISPVEDPDCPDEIKDGRSVSDVCSEEKEERFPGIDLESGFGSICRVFDFMYGCSTDLFEKCANTTPEEEERYFRDNFHSVYNAYGCSSK